MKVYEKLEIDNYIIKEGFIPIDYEWNGWNSRISFRDKNMYKYCMLWECFKFRKNNNIPKFHKSNKYSLENIKNFLNLKNINIEILSNEYIDATTKIEIIGECGHKMLIDWHHLKRKDFVVCPECSKIVRGKKRRLSQEFVEKEFDLCGYKLIDNYERNNIPLKCVDENGNILEISYANLSFGKRPKINKYSSGENIIMKELENNNIIYFPQYIFKDCKNERCLPFDFYLPEYNCCIEFDGEQHYKSIEYFGGKEKFDKIKINDNIKNNYCKDNGIKLLRLNNEDLTNKKYKNKILSVKA